MSVVDDPKVNNVYTQDKINALKNYNSNNNYEYQCNVELYHILDKAN